MEPESLRLSAAALEAPGDRVHLVVPPSSEFLRTARLVAADAAGRAGCDVDEVEDFRIAVDELCHLLMTSTDHLVHLSFTTFSARVVARGSARARSGKQDLALPEVSALIVASTSDQHEIETRGGQVGFTVMKRARQAPAYGGNRRFASQQ